MGMMQLQQDIELRGELRVNEPMWRYTTWRVGGIADHLYRPADVEDLCVFLQQLNKDEPLYWLGLGSNLLVRDGGIRGTVIATQGALNEIQQMSEDTVRAEAGVSCAKVARFCSRLCLTGAEFLAGIPGTMGGALAMNAGAFDGETWAIVTAVETMDRYGNLHTRSPRKFKVGYRSVEGPEGEWFVAAHLRLQKVSEEKEAEIREKMKGLLEKRNESQPIGLPSCGSVFRNPAGDHAARLIEASGLKGYCIGGACVSRKHANFIINEKEATAADIEQLIQHVAKVVKDKQGIELQPEVRIVGEEAGRQ